MEGASLMSMCIFHEHNGASPPSRVGPTAHRTLLSGSGRSTNFVWNKYSEPHGRLPSNN